jgi:hemerythrin
MITWDNSMATGLSDLDAQHREIIKKFNEFSEALWCPNGMDRQVAGEVLDFLQFYALWHFEREEKCMERYHCPAAAVNKHAHAEFIKKFGGFYEQWQAGGMDLKLVRETYLELEKWIVTHIRQVDTELYPCVKR